MKKKKEYWILLLVGLFTFLSIFRMNVVDLNTDALTAFGSTVVPVLALKEILWFLIGFLLTLCITGFVYSKVSKERTNKIATNCVKILEYIFITVELEIGFVCTELFDLTPVGYVLPIILLSGLIVTLFLTNEKLKSSIVLLILMCIDVILMCLDLNCSKSIFVAVLAFLVGIFVSNFIKDKTVSICCLCTGIAVSACILSYTFGYNQAKLTLEQEYKARMNALEYKYEHQLKAKDTSMVQSEDSTLSRFVNKLTSHGATVDTTKETESIQEETEIEPTTDEFDISDYLNDYIPITEENMYK